MRISNLLRVLLPAFLAFFAWNPFFPAQSNPMRGGIERHIGTNHFGRVAYAAYGQGVIKAGYGHGRSHQGHGHYGHNRQYGHNRHYGTIGIVGTTATTAMATGIIRLVTTDTAATRNIAILIGVLPMTTGIVMSRIEIAPRKAMRSNKPRGGII